MNLSKRFESKKIHEKGVKFSFENLNLLYPAKDNYSFDKYEGVEVYYKIKHFGQEIGYFYPDLLVDVEQTLLPCADRIPRTRTRIVGVKKELETGKWVKK